jgi:hypothetical protein
VLGEPEHARGLGEAGGDLGPQPVVADAHRAGEPGSVADDLLDLGRQRLGVVRGRAEERLVPAQDLDHDRQGRQRGHHHLGHRVVGRRVRRQEHRVGAQPGRGAQRHARVDAEAAGLVRRGGDHRPLRRVARPAHHHRLAPQLGVPGHLDRGEELVEVDVEDPARLDGRGLSRPGAPA